LGLLLSTASTTCVKSGMESTEGVNRAGIRQIFVIAHSRGFEYQ
jgi:hypothetical protein